MRKSNHTRCNIGRATNRFTFPFIDKFGVPYLGALPLDTDYLKACESGKPVEDGTNASKRLETVIDNMIGRLSTSD